MSTAITALNDIQSAIFVALTGDTTLMNAITGIFDFVPQNQSFPYIAFGLRTEMRLDTMGTWGKDATFEMKIWTQAKGFNQAQDILNKMNTVIGNYPSLVVSGWTIVCCRCENAVCIEDPDGITKQISARYRIQVVP